MECTLHHPCVKSYFQQAMGGEGQFIPSSEYNVKLTHNVVFDLCHAVTEKQKIYCVNLMFSAAEIIKISMKMVLRLSQVQKFQCGGQETKPCPGK